MLFDEIVVGDLMREYNYTCDQIMKLGYFEAYRLWFIVDEIKARDLFHQTLVNDYPQANKEYREEIVKWLDRRRPREINKTSSIPKEVWEKFKEAFNNGRRK